MNRPSIRTYLLGNPLSVCAAIGTTAYFAYRCWTGVINPVLPGIMVMVTLSAFNAAGRIGKFHRWRREWNAMNGGEVRQGFRLPRIPAGLRIGIGSIIWVALAIYVAQHGDEPALRLPTLLFWLTTALLIAWGLVGGLARLRRRGATRAVVVKICQGRPWASPTVAEAFAALPAYCSILLVPPGQIQEHPHA